MKSLHAVDRRAPARVLFREHAFAVQPQVARDLGDDVGQVIGDRELIEIELLQELVRLNAPLGDDLFLAATEDVGDVLSGAVFQGVDASSSQSCSSDASVLIASDDRRAAAFGFKARVARLSPLRCATRWAPMWV